MKFITIRHMLLVIGIGNWQLGNQMLAIRA